MFSAPILLAVRSAGVVVMNYIWTRQTLHVRYSAPNAEIIGTTNPPLVSSKGKSVAYDKARHASPLRICNTPQRTAHTKSNDNHIPPIVFAIPVSTTSESLTGIDSDAGDAARHRLIAGLPQLPQISASGWSFSPHLKQNIVAHLLSVYANSEYKG